jgi:hypothetical protein
MTRLRTTCLTFSIALVGIGFAPVGDAAAGEPARGAESSPKPRVALKYDAGAAPVAFGAERIRRALERAGYAVEPADAPPAAPRPAAAAPARIAIRVQPPGAAETGGDSARLPAEGFSIRRAAHGGAVVVEILGGDAAGAMYGALDLAEQIRHGAALDRVEAKTAAPRFPFRAVKFNLPWMSYRRHESLQLHDETCRDLEFWREFLDMMAENRFNALTLWSLHPFTWMIRPTNFPEACGFSDEELAEWQEFWRALFRMAKDRGIDTYVVNWNIFVSPEFSRKHGVSPHSAEQHFWGEGDTSELVARYTREVVAQVIDEYPDLTGLGITLGEGMGGMTPEARRDWIDRAFIAGMKAAKRPARLIYRAPLSAGTASGGSTSVETERLTREAVERLDLPAPVWVEFKFNWSHAHSSPRLSIVHGGRLGDTYWDPPPTNYRLAWMMRNEDFFRLRWGEPDFIRRHVELNGQDHVGGYFVGSECYIPAKDYLQRPDPRVNWRYAFQRQWLFYMLWGRLLYDPATPDAVFARAFDARYGEGAGEVLLPAFAAVSRMPLRLASLHRATWDFTLYAEGFLAPAGSAGKWRDDSPFISIDELIHQETLDPDYMSIAEYVRALARGAEIAPERITPPALADALQRDAEGALARIDAVEWPPGPVEFELADIRAWAHLSLYFAEKLRGGVALHTFRQTGKPSDQAEAVARLRRAAGHWDRLVEVTRPIYPETPLIHTGQTPFSWARYRDRVRRDVEIAESAP